MEFILIILGSAFCCYFTADAVIKRYQTPLWLFYSLLIVLYGLQIYYSSKALSLTFNIKPVFASDVITLTSLMCAFSGPFMEGYIIHYSKAWEYKDKQIFGLIPYYLPIIWATTGSGIIMMMCLAFNASLLLVSI